MTYVEPLVAADLDDVKLNSAVAAFPSFVYKKSATSVVTSTLITDPALRLPVRADAIYLAWCVAIYAASVGGDLKIGWSLPAGATALNWTGRYRDATPVDVSGAYATHSLLSVISGDASRQSWTGKAVIRCGPSVIAGSVAAIRWAQNVTDATATTIHRGSWLRLTRVA